jgi:hypothetical protein
MDDQLFHESWKDRTQNSTIKVASVLPFITDGKGNRDEPALVLVEVL